MKRFLVPAIAIGLMVASAATALANAGPPRPSAPPVSPPLAAVMGAAGAVLAGMWISRRIKP
jgi:hypothetical protein